MGGQAKTFPQTPENPAKSLPVGQYDELRPKFTKMRNEEYRKFVKMVNTFLSFADEWVS